MAGVHTFPAPPPDAALEQAVTRRTGRRLLPLLFLLYVVCFVDRTNVGFAALQMNRDLAFGPAVYGLGAGVFFLGYALFEVPSNLALARVGARRWIGRIAVTWGALAAAMLFVRSAGSFYAMRFLLGVAEAGFFPGVVYYLGAWFPERQRGRAMSRFMIAVPLAGAVGGPLGALLLGLDGRLGLAGWQWLFLLEGLPAVLLGAVAYRTLPDDPRDARWLPAAERAWLLERLAAERAAAERPPRERLTLGRALAGAEVRRLCAPYFLVGVASYGLALWLPTLLKELAPAGDRGAGLAVGLIGAAGAAGMLLNGAHSDRSRERVWHAAVPLALAAVGLVAALAPRPAIAALGLAVASVGFHAFLPVFWCLPRARLRGSAAAGAIALVNAVASLGGFVGPNVLGVAKTATGHFDLGLLVLAGLTLAAALLTLGLRGAASAPFKRGAAARA